MLRGILIAMTPSVNDSNGIVRSQRSFNHSNPSEIHPPILRSPFKSQAPCTSTHFCSLHTRYSGRSVGFLAESADFRSRLLILESRISNLDPAVLSSLSPSPPHLTTSTAPAPTHLYLSAGGRSGRHHVRRPHHDRRPLAQGAHARVPEDVQTEDELHNITLYAHAQSP